MPDAANQEYFKILKISASGTQEEVRERFHRYHEFFYIAEGECAVFIDRRTYHLKAGDFAVIPAGKLHKTDTLSLSQSTKYVISFSREIAAHIDQFLGEPLVMQCLSPGRVTAPVQRRDAILLILNRMLYEFQNQPPHAHAVCIAFLTELLISILRYRTGEEEKDGTLETESHWIHDVAAYISEHACEDLTLTGIAKHFAVSPSHLSRSFRETTGFGIKEYLSTLRIQLACELLLNTHLTITEIADRCGFSDSNYFGDAFKKATGLSPRDYRKLT